MGLPAELISFLSRFRYRVTPATLADGDLAEATCDSTGALRVSGAIVAGARPTAISRGTAAIERVVFAGASALIEAWGYNLSGSTRYLHFFDATTVPADGAASALEVIQIPAGGSFSLAPAYPLAFLTGLCWAFSTTEATLTRSTADGRVTVSYTTDATLR